MMKLGEIRETATGSVWLTKRMDLGTYAVMVFTQKARGWFTQYSGSLKECRARAEELLKEMTEEETAAETATEEEPETITAETATNIFVHDVYFTKPGKPITVKFTNGREEQYTTNILGLLKTDPECEWIADSETGELIYWKE